MSVFYPGAEEACNGVDDNCDGRVDLGEISTWYTDDDGDGYGHPAQYSQTCDPEPGWLRVGGDCSPGDATVHPGAPELCDDVDQDCDGEVDEDFDLDGDGYQSTACDGGVDCDDGNAAIHPDADEICGDGVDDDCDGSDTTCGFASSYDLASAPVKY